MLNKSTDALFLLIKSLTKSEKKNFKLYITRNSKRKNLRTVTLFDILDKMNHYEEDKILKKYEGLPKQQLLNIKTLLYNEILSSLRLLSDEDNIEIRLNEQMDYARILYSKGLYIQSLKVLEKMKELAASTHQLSHLHQCLTFEKKIESLHITRSIRSKAYKLTEETTNIHNRLILIGNLSNLSLRLYSWYIKKGHACNRSEELELRSFFEKNLPESIEQSDGFYEQLYLCQCYCWFKFILQDFFRYYKYAQKWVDLFEFNAIMKKIETPQYIKGLHNLASAHFYLKNYKKHNEIIDIIEAFSNTENVLKTQSYKVQTFIYLYTARINKHFMEGSFSEGLSLIPVIEENLSEYKLFMDNHRTLVFYYKIACLYFGSGNNGKAIDYLNKIINLKTDLRNDLQCYARLLHLIAHYEIGNYEIIEYLIKSVYRMMGKMNNLSVVEEEIFIFLRLALRSSRTSVEKEFITLHHKLLQHASNPLETRAYAYLDIISWLESKLYKIPVQTIIQNKYLNAKHK